MSEPTSVDDPFLDYWSRHPIHGTEIPPDVVEKFREFASEFWRASRNEMAARYGDLILAVTHEVKGEPRHETARRYIVEGDAKVGAEKERHSRLAGG